MDENQQEADTLKEYKKVTLAHNSIQKSLSASEDMCFEPILYIRLFSHFEIRDFLLHEKYIFSISWSL